MSHTNLARKLRANQTDVESRMWQQLRARRFCNLKFKRQVPVGRYIADFLCESEKLIIEIDGWDHAHQLAEDEVRSRDLEALGYRIICSSSTDVRHKLADVLHELKSYIGEGRPHLPSSALRAPSPQGEG